jgi:hypothetical protein
MPVQITVKVGPGAKIVRKGLQDLRAEIPKIGRETIYAMLEKARDEVSVPPSRPKPPGLWDSEKQQIAYFKSGGFGAGIPYKPTGKSSRSWVIRKAGDIGWTLTNTFKAAKYLFGNAEGEGQSVIHAGRRPLFALVLKKHVEKLPKTIQNNINSFIKKLGFK